MPLDVALFGNHSFSGHQAVTTIVTHPMRGGEGRVAKPGYGSTSVCLISYSYASGFPPACPACTMPSRGRSAPLKECLVPKLRETSSNRLVGFRIAAIGAQEKNGGRKVWFRK